MIKFHSSANDFFKDIEVKIESNPIEAKEFLVGKYHAAPMQVEGTLAAIKSK